jgi:hypothetical protein
MASNPYAWADKYIAKIPDNGDMNINGVNFPPFLRDYKIPEQKQSAPPTNEEAQAQDNGEGATGLASDIGKSVLTGIAKVPDVIVSGIQSAASGYAKAADFAAGNMDSERISPVEAAIQSGIGTARDITTRKLSEAVEKALPLSKANEEAIAAKEASKAEKLKAIEQQGEQPLFNVTGNEGEAAGAAKIAANEAFNWAKRFGAGAAATIENPRSAVQSVAESIPQFVALGAVAKAGGVASDIAGASTNASKLANAAKIAEANGDSVLARTLAEKATAAAEKAATYQNTAYNLGGNFALEGQGGEQSARDEFKNIPIETLRKNAEFVDLEKRYGTDEAIKIAMESAGTKAYAPAGALGALVSGATGGGLETAALQGFKGAAKDGLIKGVVKGATKEGLEETGQGGTGQYAQNIATNQYTGKSDFENVPEMMGESGAMGFLSGGAGHIGGHVYDKAKDRFTGAKPETATPEQAELQQELPPEKPKAEQPQPPKGVLGKGLFAFQQAQMPTPTSVSPSNVNFTGAMPTIAAGDTLAQAETQQPIAPQPEQETTQIAEQPAQPAEVKPVSDAKVESKPEPEQSAAQTQVQTATETLSDRAEKILAEIDDVISKGVTPTPKHAEDLINAAESLGVNTNAPLPVIHDNLEKAVSDIKTSKEANETGRKQAKAKAVTQGESAKVSESGIEPGKTLGTLENTFANETVAQRRLPKDGSMRVEKVGDKQFIHVPTEAENDKSENATAQKANTQEEVAQQTMTENKEVAKQPLSEMEQAKESIDEEAHKAATSPLNDLPEPTQAQKESGNYKKGHIKLHGLDIAIENPKGSERSGIDQDGKKWAVELAHHYGYIKNTKGNDGDHVDVFIGNNPESQKAFVVNQIDVKSGKFDEHKVMLGFNTFEEAKAGYLANYEEDWKGGNLITELSIDELKDILYSGKLNKPIKNKATVQQSEAFTKNEQPEKINTESAKGRKADKVIIPIGTYHGAITILADELIEGGGVSYLYDENGKINGRTSSINPDWFKDNNFVVLNPKTGNRYKETVSVSEIKDAVYKYNKGEALIARERAILDSLNDVAYELEEANTNNHPDDYTYEQTLLDNHVQQLVDNGDLSEQELDDLIAKGESTLDDYDDTIPFDTLPNLSASDAMRVLGFSKSQIEELTNDTKTSTGSIERGSGAELLTDYTSEDITERETKQREAEQEQIAKEQAAEKKRKADSEVNTLADEMLGIGKTTTTDLFDLDEVTKEDRLDSIDSSNPKSLVEKIRTQDLGAVLNHIIASKSSFSRIAVLLRSKMPKGLSIVVEPELKAEKDKSRDIPAKFSKYGNNGKPVITINKKYLDDRKTKDTDLMIYVLHELVHAETVFALADKNNREFRNELDDIIIKILDASKSHGGYLVAKDKNGKERPLFKASRLFNKEGKPIAEELVAYGFTDPMFQIALQEIEHSKDFSLWEKFVELVTKAIGISVRNVDSTALGAVFRISTELMDIQAKQESKDAAKQPVVDKLIKSSEQTDVVEQQENLTPRLAAALAFFKRTDSIKPSERERALNAMKMSNNPDKDRLLMIDRNWVDILSQLEGKAVEIGFKKEC